MVESDDINVIPYLEYSSNYGKHITLTGRRILLSDDATLNRARSESGSHTYNLKVETAEETAQKYSKTLVKLENEEYGFEKTLQIYVTSSKDLTISLSRLTNFTENSNARLESSLASVSFASMPPETTDDGRTYYYADVHKNGDTYEVTGGGYFRFRPKCGKLFGPNSWIQLMDTQYMETKRPVYMEMNALETEDARTALDIGASFCGIKVNVPMSGISALVPIHMQFKLQDAYAVPAVGSIMQMRYSNGSLPDTTSDVNLSCWFPGIASYQSKTPQIALAYSGCYEIKSAKSGVSETWKTSYATAPSYVNVWQAGEYELSCSKPTMTACLNKKSKLEAISFGYDGRYQMNGQLSAGTLNKTGLAVMSVCLSSVMEKHAKGEDPKLLYAKFIEFQNNVFPKGTVSCEIETSGNWN